MRHRSHGLNNSFYCRYYNMKNSNIFSKDGATIKYYKQVLLKFNEINVISIVL